MAKPLRLVEGVDYYLEGTRFVFTSHFLLKRGYCCNSGCRHCPYKQPEEAVAIQSSIAIVGLGDVKPPEER